MGIFLISLAKYKKISIHLTTFNEVYALSWRKSICQCGDKNNFGCQTENALEAFIFTIFSSKSVLF